MVETACETVNTCNTDELSFKAYLSRWMAASSKLAPFIYDQVKPKIRASAAAAALQCSGGASGTICGAKWTQGATYDGTNGVGQQMSALEVIQANLIMNQTAAQAPVTAATGGTSVGDPSAGTSPQNSPYLAPVLTQQITTLDKAGAGVLTAGLVIFICGTSTWALVGM